MVEIAKGVRGNNSKKSGTAVDPIFKYRTHDPAYLRFTKHMKKYYRSYLWVNGELRISRKRFKRARDATAYAHRAVEKLRAGARLAREEV